MSKEIITIAKTAMVFFFFLQSCAVNQLLVCEDGIGICGLYKDCIGACHGLIERTLWLESFDVLYLCIKQKR